MVLFCCIVGCGMRGDRDETSFFRIPAVISVKNRKFKTTYCNPLNPLSRVESDLAKSGDEFIKLSKKRQDKWVNAIKRGKLTASQLKTFRVCSKHFITGRPADINNHNDPDWAPCQNLGYEKGVSIKNRTDLDKYHRSEKRRVNKENMLIEKMVEQIVQNDNIKIEDAGSQIKDSEDNNHVVENFNIKVGCDVETQTDLDINELTLLFEKLTLYGNVMKVYETKLKKFDLSQESFKNDNAKTKYFSGLENYEVLSYLHEVACPFLFTRSNTKLNTFQQLIVTLMILRLNLPYRYFSYRFGVSAFTISTYFRRCLHVLYKLLKNFIIWPDRETLHATMPQCFLESFGKQVTVILDCFEIFIEKPKSFNSSAECWSNYKHHRTLKYLIGITPQGSISFISEGYGGRASDKFVTEDCGILDLLLPGSVVLADRGFLIENCVHQVGAKLKIPAFTKGKSQLHPKELEETREIANVRIHVERVIGSLRQKYPILSGTVPISLLRTKQNGVRVFDEIVHVCCALINLCPSMVSLK